MKKVLFIFISLAILSCKGKGEEKNISVISPEVLETKTSPLSEEEQKILKDGKAFLNRSVNERTEKVLKEYGY